MEYKSTIRKLRAIRPDLSMSSDFIVGFPGETEEDFQKVMKMITDVGYDSSFSFIFSPRPGTPAANLPDDTPYELKVARLQQLQAANEAHALSISRQLVGTHQLVLVTGNARKDPSELMGRTECNRIVNFKGAARLMNELIQLNSPRPTRIPCVARCRCWQKHRPEAGLRRASIPSMRLADFMGPLLAFIARVITGAQGHWKGCPPSNEQRIYIANHQSHFDLVLIWAALPTELRPRIPLFYTRCIYL